MMDYALRRRFSFYEVETAFGKPKFKVYLEKYIHTAAVVDKVINRFKELNTKQMQNSSYTLSKLSSEKMTYPTIRL